MKYFSEILNKCYDSEKDCLMAEEAYKTEQAEKKAKAEAFEKEKKEMQARVNQAAEAVSAASRAYRKILSEYNKKYGTYTTTYRTSSDSLTDLFDMIFKA